MHRSGLYVHARRIVEDILELEARPFLTAFRVDDFDAAGNPANLSLERFRDWGLSGAVGACRLRRSRPVAEGDSAYVFSPIAAPLYMSMTAVLPI